MSGLSNRRVAVAVLGDIGRSPRMMYHALAFAAGGASVRLVGYSGSDLPRLIDDDDSIECRRLPAPPALARGPAWGWRALKRVVSQAARLLRTLDAEPRPEMILVQTPPGFPLVPVAVLLRRRGIPVVVDWHNYGWSVLALRFGAGHPLVRLMRWLEVGFARQVDAHLCVSQAMRENLDRELGVAASVLYDRASPRFRPLAEKDRAGTLRRLAGPLDLDAETVDGLVARRVALIVTATSWTPDEDLSLLLEALREWDREVDGGRIVVVVSGRGELREDFERELARVSLQRVRARTVWLSAEEYPFLLAVADLGLCLHRSSSGLDLPMKVSDMLGACTPVCALDYGDCLREVIREGENGFFFENAGGLIRLVREMLAGYPDEKSGLAMLRSSTARTTRESWYEGWCAEAAPVFSAVLDAELRP